MNSSFRSAPCRPKVTFNAPAVLGFALVCLAALIIDRMTGGAANDYVFSVYRWPLYRPMAWVRLICHIFGHAGWDHLLGNMMYILILGPMLEEKYGSWNIVFVMLATAAVTGLVHMAFFPGLALCGASGVVFAFILLSSITDIREGEIPLTFILVAVLYIGQQVYQCFFYKDNISQFTHILGGGVGAVLGFFMNRKGLTRYRAQR
ncbi:MAG: rhomboid family intramembrane serine protease [Clostridia bacterium]|nr:rhomboid family intramembrane serine protease [Clostridia bacterium]